MHRDGIITEGSSTNVFIVKDGTLYTHPANNLILNGITRRVIIDIAKKEGIPIKETAFSIDEFLHADEAFTSSTTAEIMPIVSVLLDEKTYALGTGKRGVITQKIQDAYSGLIDKIPQNQSTL